MGGFLCRKNKTASDKNRCTAQLDPTAVNNGILVPIIFIIIIGVVSYQKSYEGLTQNYEKSALTAIDMTADGRMISVNNPVDSGLIDTAESSSYVKVDGRRYYYMSAESSVTGGKIVVMVPIEYITAGTKDIRDITIAMIVAACIAAMLIATVITAGITRNIRKSIGRLDRVANGDLTVQEKEKRKKVESLENFPRHYFIPLQE